MTICRRSNDGSEAYPGGSTGCAARSESRHAAALRAADWLLFESAPIFAIMIDELVRASPLKRLQE